MPSIAHPLWLLAPLLALAALAIGRRRMQLPGAWQRAIQDDLKTFLAATVRQVRAPWRSVALVALWLLLGAALANISLGQIETPKLRNLDARIVVIDLGIPEIAQDRIAAARYLIDSADDVPTAVVAVTEHAFDVVPLTRDDAHLDRYLQVLTKDVMPVEGRSLLRGIERAVALLDRAGIQARQITVFTGGPPPPIGRFEMPERTEDHNIWLVLPEDADAAWRALAAELDARLISDREAPSVHQDFEQRRRDAAAKAVSIRERQDITHWLILLLMPLWLLLFFRRQPE
ncbi:MAG: hypothetical protein OEU92_10995 [Alphaproteobacteria bacterium]|nr:hypothetical protein [Alphaproteobacteria bacterium]